MHQAISKSIAFIALCCFPLAQANPVVNIIESIPPAWIEHKGKRSELHYTSKIKINDHLITGKTGRIEIQLDSNTILQLESNSRIFMLPTEKNGFDQLHLFKGNLCIFTRPSNGYEVKAKVNIDNILSTNITGDTNTCITRQHDLSTILLLKGSIQVTHSIDSNTVILSNAGTEIQVNDNGFSDLVFIHPDESSANADANELPGSSPVNITDTSINGTAENPDTETPDNITLENIKNKKNYKVYLYSTHSKKTAIRINKKFHNANYNTQIYKNDTGLTTYYRIAVPDFDSLESAQAFSDSVIGTLGITDTWIE